MKKILQFFKDIIKNGTIIQKILLILFVLYIPFSLSFIWESDEIGKHPYYQHLTENKSYKDGSVREVYIYLVGDYVYLKDDLIIGKVVKNYWKPNIKGVTYQELISWLLSVSFIIFCMYVFQRNEKN